LGPVNLARAARGILALTTVFAAILPFAVSSPPFLADVSPLQAWWLIMVAGGISLFILTIGTTWQWAGILAAALLVGTSSQLGLTSPLWFQEINLQISTKFDLALYAAIAAQALVAAFFLVLRAARSGKVAAAISQLRRTLGVVRTAVFFLLLIAFSVTAMNYIAQQNLAAYLSRLAVTIAFLAVNIATVVALALSLPERGLSAAGGFIEKNISLPGAAGRVRPLDRVFPYAVALWVLAVSGAICFFAFEHMTRLGDELAYVMQARYFSLGRLSAPIPPIPALPGAGIPGGTQGLDCAAHLYCAAFNYLGFDVVGDKWFSMFPPGWPLVLTLGAFVGLEWLVDPILGATSILLAFALLRRETDRGTANLVITLLAVSPWFLAMSASFLSHTSSLALWLASCLVLSKARDSRSGLLALLGGGLMGLLFLARPLDGLVMGTLTGLWTLGFRNQAGGWRAILSYGLGCFAVGALIFPYNAHLTGDPFKTPIDTFFERQWDGSSRQLGFGDDIGPPKPWHGVDLYAGHSPIEAAIFDHQYVYALNFELFGWAIGSLALFFFHAVWGRWSRTDLYMLAIIAGIMGAYSLYWNSGAFHIGPRYWFMMVLPLAAITASGIATASRKLETAAIVTLPVQRLALVLAVLSAIAMVSFLTWRGTTKYFEIRRFHADYRALLEKHKLGGSLIFIRNSRLRSEIGSASFFNSISFDRDKPIFVLDLGPEANRAVAAAFPDRPIYFAVGRTPDGAKARIVAGPIGADELGGGSRRP